MAADAGGPVTLVTGTSSGIGRALATDLLERGHVVVGVARRPSGIEHERFHDSPCDVTDEAAVRRLVDGVRREHGRIDHLVNNAGAASMNHALMTPTSTFERLLEVNTVATFRMCREVAKVMARRRVGRIVNLTSIAVPLALDGEAAYVAAKAAVEGLTRALARDLGGMGITVNAVGPAPVHTPLLSGVGEERLAKLVARQAIPRWCTEEDVVHAVRFFLDDASAMVTGQVLYLGGLA